MYSCDQNFLKVITVGNTTSTPLPFSFLQFGCESHRVIKTKLAAAAKTILLVNSDTFKSGLTPSNQITNAR